MLFWANQYGTLPGWKSDFGHEYHRSSIQEWWWIGILPVCYIAAITMISRGEVHGGNKNILYFAAFLYVLVSIFSCYLF